MTQVTKISEARDLLGYVPYHLGFHPDESVVAISVRPGRTEGERSYIGLTMRIDIGDLLDAKLGKTNQKLLRPHMEDDGASAVLLILYSKTNPAAKQKTSEWSFSPEQLRSLIAGLTGEFDTDLPITGFWVVTDEKYFELDNGHIPPEGEWLNVSELQSAKSAAAAVYAGSSIAPSREALGEISRAPAADRDRAQRATLRWLQRRKYEGDQAWQLDSWQLWERAIAAQLRTARRDSARRSPDQHSASEDTITASAGPCPGPTDDPLLLGRLQAGLEDIKIRDAVMISNIPGIKDLPERSVVTNAREEVGKSVDLILDPAVGISPGEEAAAISQILRAIAAHCASARSAPTLTLLAWLAWWEGEGARAAVLVDRALTIDPSYNMARLVDRMVEIGLPPGWVKRERNLAEVG